MVNSKAKLDRYDLMRLFYTRLAVLEDEIQSQILLRKRNVTVFAEYGGLHDHLGQVRLGRSTSDELDAELFSVLEPTSSSSESCTRLLALPRFGALFSTPARKGKTHTPSGTNRTLTNYAKVSLRCDGFVNVNRVRRSCVGRNGIA